AGAGDGNRADRSVQGLVRSIEVLGHLHGEAARRDQAKAEGRDGDCGSRGRAGGGDAGSDGGAAREYRGTRRDDASDTEVAATRIVPARWNQGAVGSLGGEKPPGQAALSGAEGDRTPDLCHAMAALSQLSYGPESGQCSAELVIIGPVDARLLIVCVKE